MAARAGSFHHDSNDGTTPERNRDSTPRLREHIAVLGGKIVEQPSQGRGDGNPKYPLGQGLLIALLAWQSGAGRGGHCWHVDNREVLEASGLGTILEQNNALNPERFLVVCALRRPMAYGARQGRQVN